MGENEQGGMLRNVVVLGLIALIAGVIIALVLGLKTKMVDHVDEATPPSMILNMMDSKDFSMEMHHGANDKYISYGLPKNAYRWDDSATELHFDTRTLSNPTWARGVSKVYKIPAGSKRMKFEIQVKGSGTGTAIPYITVKNKDNSNYIHDGVPTADVLNNKTYETVSKIYKLGDQVNLFEISLETREGMQVDYKNATVTFYNH